MSNIKLKEIRYLTIQGLSLQFLPISIFGYLESQIENTIGSAAISFLMGVGVFICFLFGYAICCLAINKYARYKGRKNYFYIYSILNIFGLSLLFLLTNKNQSKAIDSDRNPLVNFSISSIFISWVAIPIVCMPLVYLIALGINGIDGFEEYISGDGNFLIIANFIGQVFLALYFFNELKRAKINYKHILGSLKQIDFKLPIMLTAAQYFFNGGINSFTLYGLSFIIPQYVENHINHQYATDIVGYIGFAISAMLFAPLIEEFFFRGMIFQKLALTRGIVKAMVISAIAFALVHFRYDLIPLFIFGILYVILYLKTKQLAVPILAHFFYNATVVAVRIYDHFFGDVDPSLPLTVADYQQQFLEHWQWNILYIALSAPYLCYFVYKNFPRSNDTDKLPYFANRKISGRST